MIFLVLGLATLFVTADTNAEVFSYLWNTQKVFDSETAALVLLGLAILVLSALVVQVWKANEPATGEIDDGNLPAVVLRATPWLFSLTVVGYVSFVVVGALRGISLNDLVEAVSSQNVGSGKIERTVGTVPGLTTLTQVGPAALITSLYSFLLHEKKRQYIWYVIIIIALSIARAFFFTERAAVTELLVPAAVVLSFYFAGTQRGRLARDALPVIALPLGLGLFAGFEYTRSWQTYSQTYTGTFWDFISSRFAGYYATAYNNSAIVMNYPPAGGQVPHATLAFIWEFPGISGFNLEQRLNGFNYSTYYTTALYNYGNWEYNNPGGIGSVFADWGLPAALVVLALLGGITGHLYNEFARSQAVGILVYPYWFVGVLELPRFIFWTQGGVSPSIVILLFLGLYARRQRQPPRGKVSALSGRTQKLRPYSPS